jgi:hypothetical protein
VVVNGKRWGMSMGFFVFKKNCWGVWGWVLLRVGIRGNDGGDFFLMDMQLWVGWILAGEGVFT